eukprot:6181650-Pleurochrysis_carterae.AAC.3
MIDRCQWQLPKETQQSSSGTDEGRSAQQVRLRNRRVRDENSGSSTLAGSAHMSSSVSCLRAFLAMTCAKRTSRSEHAFVRPSPERTTSIGLFHTRNDGGASSGPQLSCQTLLPTWFLVKYACKQGVQARRASQACIHGSGLRATAAPASAVVSSSYPPATRCGDPRQTSNHVLPPSCKGLARRR